MISVALWSDKSHIPGRFLSPTKNPRDSRAFSRKYFSRRHFPRKIFFVCDSSENLFRTAGEYSSKLLLRVFSHVVSYVLSFVCEDFNKCNISEFLTVAFVIIHKSITIAYNSITNLLQLHTIYCTTIAYNFCIFTIWLKKCSNCKNLEKI